LWKDRCVDAWASSDDKNNQAERLRVNGIFAGEHKNHDKANQLLENALGVWCDLRQSRSIAAVLGDLGNLAHVRQEFDTAELRYHGALEAMQETKDKEGIADYSGRLGRLAHARSQWMEARRWFEQELMLGKEVNRLDLIAHAQYGLARVHEAEGHADLALPLAQDALKIYERLQHRDLAEARELVERLQKAGGSKQ
jgi:tetratricopeptide (TPR) repeat protein